MAQENDAGKVATRFASDVLAIQRQIEFQQRRSTVTVQEIDEHNKTLCRFELDQLPSTDFVGFPPHELREHEISQLVPHIQRLKPKVERLQDDYINRVSELAENHHGFPDFGLADQLGHDDYATADCVFDEWTRYFEASLSDEQLLKQSDEVIADQGITSKIATGEPCHHCDEFGWVIASAAREAKLNRLNSHASSLVNLNIRLEEIEIIAESNESPIGLMRQSFIAMMASFDAALFDLIRIALKNDFFTLVGKLEKKDRVTVDIASAGTWIDLRDMLIDTQLRKHYAIGWLNILNSKWSAFDLSNRNLHFPRACEQVNRRNILLHNRGVVDVQYCQKFNLDNLKIGDLARITEKYWYDAKMINGGLIHRVASWAADLSSSSN